MLKLNGHRRARSSYFRKDLEVSGVYVRVYAVVLAVRGLSRTSPTFTNGVRFRDFGQVSDLNFCQGDCFRLDESKAFFCNGEN